MILAHFRRSRNLPAPDEQQLAGLAGRGIDGILVKGDVSERPQTRVMNGRNRSIWASILAASGSRPDVDNRAMSAVMEYGEMEPFDQILTLTRRRPTEKKSTAALPEGTAG